MNNKGFTLVELLATIVIIGLIMGIATTSAISTINNSKKKSEKVFVDKLATAIESYININGSQSSEITGTEVQFEKCRRVNDDNTCLEGTSKTVEVTELTPFNLKDITTGDTATISEDKIVNPSTKEKCLNGTNPEVRLFKDDDYVYYYYVDLSRNNTSCNISDENSIVTNIPKKLCSAINTGKIESEKLKCEE